MGQRCEILDLIEKAGREGARLHEAARVLGVHPRTVEVWRKERIHFLREIGSPALQDALLKLERVFRVLAGKGASARAPKSLPARKR